MVPCPYFPFIVYREDEGKDLVGKRGSEFKLPYPIIDTDPTGLGAALEEEEYVKSKSPKTKKSKSQLRDYLQAGRKRKTPYRDVYNGINGYAPYTGLNGYPACQPGTEVKPEFMYPYTGQNFAFDTTDFYRTGYHTLAGGMYSTTDTFRLEAEKHGYANGYYLEPRQYQHTLQYHGNGYSDIMAQTAKYGYDMSKYGYADHVSGYGLDLSKRPAYDEDLSRYENDLRKYSGYGSDKLSRVNGTYDPLRTGSLYGTNPVLNNDGLLSCSTSHSISPSCSLYRSDLTNSSDRYNQACQPKVSPTSSVAMAATDNLDCSSSKQQQQQQQQHLSNGHASVIRNASPRTKSPSGQRSSDQNGDISTLYSSESAASGGILPGCLASGSTWPNTHNSSTNGQACIKARNGESAQHMPSALSSRIMSPTNKPLEGSAAESSVDVVPTQTTTTSPPLASTATSVIQQPMRNR